MAADVAGCSRLIGADEGGTLQALKAIRAELIDPTIAAHHGRLVKTTGDGLLLEFGSVVDALRCATEVQAGMAQRNLTAPDDPRCEGKGQMGDEGLRSLGVSLSPLGPGHDHVDLLSAAFGADQSIKGSGPSQQRNSTQFGGRLKGRPSSRSARTHLPTWGEISGFREVPCTSRCQRTNPCNKMVRSLTGEMRSKTIQNQ